jgi:ADP-ribose pyrophosphatase YjhB (NUDIX family)
MSVMRFALPAVAARPMMGLIHLSARLLRPLTMGVRAVILDEAGRVFLVRHSYVPGWHCPGGGIEPGETARTAMIREVREEAGLAVEGEPELHGLFLNRHMTKRDHIAVYVVRAFRVVEAPARDWEIVERGFFPIDALPEGTTKASRARLREILDGAPPAELW